MTRHKIIITLFIMGISGVVNAQNITPRGVWDELPNRQYVTPWGAEIFDTPKFNTNPGPKTTILPEAPKIVSIQTTELPGTVLIDSKNKDLYFVLDNETAFVYPIAVGRKGFQWSGVETISKIEHWPAWNPPEEMRQRQPGLPIRMEGGVNNPLGAVAMYLGNTLYRIHGSNDPKSIGTEASSGCIRMHNAHALHLANLVRIGTVVKVF